MQPRVDLFDVISLPRFPSTRYQGSKRKILPELSLAFQAIDFNSALDMYSGSGVVSLLLRYLRKQVGSNDYQLYNQTTARLFLSLSSASIDLAHYRDELRYLLEEAPVSEPCHVNERYAEVYFTAHENLQIDRFCQNLPGVTALKRDLYIYAVGQALLMKRPYNLFHRANLNMRTRNVKRSFGNVATWGKPILNHAIRCIEELREFPFEGMQRSGSVYGVNTSESLEALPTAYDLLYLDPPYINRRAIGVDYSDFYNFLEGLCDYSAFAKGDLAYPHKPILKKPSNWTNPASALDELSRIVSMWRNSILFFSYRSDGLPTPNQVREILALNGRRVETHSCGEYKYVLSRTNTNEELFIISFP